MLEIKTAVVKSRKQKIIPVLIDHHRHTGDYGNVRERGKRERENFFFWRS